MLQYVAYRLFFVLERRTPGKDIYQRVYRRAERPFPGGKTCTGCPALLVAASLRLGNMLVGVRCAKFTKKPESVSSAFPVVSWPLKAGSYLQSPLRQVADDVAWILRRLICANGLYLQIIYLCQLSTIF